MSAEAWIGSRGDREQPSRARVRRELAAAVDEIAAAFAALPEEHRPDPASRDRLDRAVDRALERGDHDRAVVDIARWRRQWLYRLEQARRGAQR